MTRIWANLLLDGFYAVSLCVSAMFFIATQRATSARWSAGLRRVPEAFMCALPVFLLMLLPLVVFEGPRTALYPWSRPGAFAHAPEIAGKARYLTHAVRLRAHRDRVRRLAAVRARVPPRLAGAGPCGRRGAAHAPAPGSAGRGLHRRLRADDHPRGLRLARVAGPQLVEHDVRGLRLRGRVRAGHRRDHAGDGDADAPRSPCAPSSASISCTTSARCCSRSRSSGRTSGSASTC